MHRFATFAIAAGSAIVSAFPLGAQHHVPSRDSVERLVRARVPATSPSGLAVGVLVPGAERYVVTAGRARPNAPVADSTMFEIGSITKAFTGILLADMVLRGEVRLDQPAQELLPSAVRIPARGRPITLLDLATHTSGLPRLPDNMDPADDANPYADYDAPRLYAFLSSHELPREPGTYEYSNLGAGLLGHLLARRAGMTFEALMKERVLAPLGMHATGVALTQSQRALAANGHDMDGNVVPWWDLDALAGAGALRSTITDMMAFANAVRQPPDNTIGRAIAFALERRATVNAGLGVGLGWHILSARGDTMFWHNGGTAGFRTMLGVVPRRGAAMVLLGNSAQNNDDLVQHVLMGLPLSMTASLREITLPASELASYAGTYELTPQFRLTVTIEEGLPWVQATGQPKFRIFAHAPDRFFLRVVEAQLEFHRDASGAVTALTLVQGGARQRAARIPRPQSDE